MSTHTCEHCQTVFKPGPGAKGRFCSKPCQHQGMALINKRLGEQRRSNKPLRSCVQCEQPITSKSGKLYCSQSCSAVYNNKARVPKINSRPSIIKITPYKSWKDNVVGPYTFVYRNICSKTNLPFYGSSYQKYHSAIIVDRQHYAYACRFKFSISQFPEWFDGSLIKTYGWYSTPGSRKGITNLNGVSRDHIVSVDYGYKHNIPPETISHPANCNLLLHKDNQRKKTSCSISLADLNERIKQFNQQHPDWQVHQDSNPEF